MSNQTRSTLRIDAVATGTAAAGSAIALKPLTKPNAIAVLAGIVLQLFRSKEQFPEGPATASRRITEGNTKETYRKSGSGALAARPGPAASQKGGTRHG